ncbi:predicted protein [Naegleria gruberi]|uniref:Predicted protein n=1 Tax=Naegleria gruberi TaxID=5762 RepID=D2VY45_NAEGR|nr:uncharacterized protein NAEGRDRAFT_53171 [Naegleria gruberi]EFC38260.1 predicted protein [Naegleria gruberi]|eukprot:XP_002671004.1 predicted protein [Naegleria gruberi strain NEG-M]
MTARKASSSSKKDSYDHPKYTDMVLEAIIQLRKRNGASLPAIKKYMEEKYELPETYNTHLKLAIKKLVESEKLVKVKGSYKVEADYKKSYMKENKIVLEKKESDDEDEKEDKKDKKSKKSKKEESDESSKKKKKIKRRSLPRRPKRKSPRRMKRLLQEFPSQRRLPRRT